ncbi:MAG: hypothetical protein ACE5FO_09320 [Parvularculaceae bacterium]
MKSVLIVAVAAISLGAAQAAPISVANGDFEGGGPLANTDSTYGDWEIGADNWSTSGAAGTFEPNLSGADVYLSAPAEIGQRVGFINAGAALSQVLSIIIAPNTSYTLSALFGDRVTATAGGSFGFFAGDASNIIATQAVAFPGEGLWSAQSFSISAELIAAYVGQQLGIVFFGGGTQLNIDNITVEAYDLDSESVVVNPLPGAIWLFGSALFAGGLARRWGIVGRRQDGR